MRTQLLAATLVRGTVVFTTTLAAVGPLAGSRRNHVTLASWLLRWARGLLVMLLDGFVMVDTAAADTLVINDLTDSLSVQGATSREVIQIIPPGSTLEGVSIVISAPAPGVTIAGRTIPDTAFLGVAEPDGITFSDAITMRPGSVGTTEAVVSFFSDVEPPPPFQLCTEVIGPCTLVENGAVQTAGTITWSDGTVDTILFCSDVEGVPSTCSTTQVPEPASLVLLGTGLAALMGFVRLESEIRRCSGRRTVGLHSWRTGQHGTTKLSGLMCEVVMRRRLTLCVAAAVFAFSGSHAAFADIVYDLNLPGIGNQIPLVSYSFTDANDLSVTRLVDAFTPLLVNAVVKGMTFPAGSLDTFDTSLSTTIPTTSFEMTGIILTSDTFIGAIGDIPTEVVTLRFEEGIFVSNTVPEASSLVLLGSGLVGIVGFIRRKLNR